MFKMTQPNGPTSGVVSGRTTQISITAQGQTVTKSVTPLYYNTEVKVTYIGVNNMVMNSVIQHETQLLKLPTFENLMTGE